jgi:hypothetical protein
VERKIKISGEKRILVITIVAITRHP